MKKILFGLFLLLALSTFISFCNNGGGEPTDDIDSSSGGKARVDSVAVKDTVVNN